MVNAGRFRLLGRSALRYKRKSRSACRSCVCVNSCPPGSPVGEVVGGCEGSGIELRSSARSSDSRAAALTGGRRWTRYWSASFASHHRGGGGSRGDDGLARSLKAPESSSASASASDAVVAVADSTGFSPEPVVGSNAGVSSSLSLRLATSSSPCLRGPPPPRGGTRSTPLGTSMVAARRYMYGPSSCSCDVRRVRVPGEGWGGRRGKC